MKGICLFFEVHQPLRLKRYRFFDIGNDHHYYDDFTNEYFIRKVAGKCYLPANRLMLELINKYKGKFKVSFSLTGVFLDQLVTYAPDVLDSFRKLAETGHVEFLAETYSHSLACMGNREEFVKQVSMHDEKVKELLGVKPVSFRNTELVYSDTIGNWVSEMGYKAILTEGAKHVLGWRSPNFLYCNAINPKLKVLLRNFTLSDDIAFRFGNREWHEWPLTTQKFAGWLNDEGENSELINLFMDYETFGEHQPAETGIMEFLKAFPGVIMKKTGYQFMTPCEVADNFQPVSAIQVPTPISWADEERDLTAWLGNDLQDAAFIKLYQMAEKVRKCNKPDIIHDWDYLQVSDHFYYMCTKFFSDGAVHAYFNPYESPYDAFMNYMNVLSDFELRLMGKCPEESIDSEKAHMGRMLEKKDEIISRLESEITILRSGINKKAAVRTAPKSGQGRAAGTASKKTKGKTKPKKSD